MLQQLLAGGLFREHPVVHLIDTVVRTEVADEVILMCTVVKHLLWLEVTHQFLYIIIGSLTREKLSRRYIKKRNAAGTLPEMNGCKEVVLLVVKHIVAKSHSWGHQLCDASLHQLLCKLRIFQLVADSHSFPGTYQLGKIGVESMVGEPRHLVSLHPGTVVSLRECYP